MMTETKMMMTMMMINSSSLEDARPLSMHQHTEKFEGDTVGGSELLQMGLDPP